MSNEVLREQIGNSEENRKQLNADFQPLSCFACTQTRDPAVRNPRRLHRASLSKDLNDFPVASNTRRSTSSAVN